MEYHYSVHSWLKAGRPHDKPFLIVRERIMDTANVTESTIQSIWESCCTLIIWSLDHHCTETEGSGYHIEPAPSALPSARSFDHKGFTFTVHTEPSTYPGPSKVRLSAGAIATILSNKEV